MSHSDLQVTGHIYTCAGTNQLVLIQHIASNDNKVITDHAAISDDHNTKVQWGAWCLRGQLEFQTNLIGKGVIY
jgi:hypothetical protein